MMFKLKPFNCPECGTKILIDVITKPDEDGTQEVQKVLVAEQNEERYGLVRRGLDELTRDNKRLYREVAELKGIIREKRLIDFLKEKYVRS